MHRSFKVLLAAAALAVLGVSAEEGTRSQRLDLFFDSSYLTPAQQDGALDATEASAASVQTQNIDGMPALWATAALVVDPARGKVLLQKNADSVQPIASITKLMTALVVLNSGESLHETLRVSPADVHYVRGTRSRFAVGQRVTRADLLRVMLVASDNRAAMALANNHPGGFARFVQKMNETAQRLGMRQSEFVDPVGLSPSNVSSPNNLAVLVQRAAQHPLIREFSSTGELTLANARSHKVNSVRNTNALTRQDDWSIALSKTGYISRAGHCLVMEAIVSNQPVVIVLLDSYGRDGRLADAQRIKQWLEQREGLTTLAKVS